MRARGLIVGCIVICIAVLAVSRALADEIRLKDGQKLYGVIVAYEDNMFKVKTDFGFVLVEKDKIASIIPTSPGSHAPAKPETQPAKSPSSAPLKPSTSKTAPPVTTAHKEVPGPGHANSRTRKIRRSTTRIQQRVETGKGGQSRSAKTSCGFNFRGDVACRRAQRRAQAAARKKITAAIVRHSSGRDRQRREAPRSIECPGGNSNPREAQGNRASSQPRSGAGQPVHQLLPWLPHVQSAELEIDRGRAQALPNAIVAMGTANESTLMVVGQEKTKSSLEATATDVENRLRDTYGNYRRISLNKTVAGGFPAIEIKYRGLAEDHDWSGTLLVVSRSGEMFSVLGMTYSDTDLIQIQENVIARAIASLEFNSN